MLLPFQGANPNFHRPRALPWAGCLLAFQAVTSRKVYRTPIIFNKVWLTDVIVKYEFLYFRFYAVYIVTTQKTQGIQSCLQPQSL